MKLHIDVDSEAVETVITIRTDKIDKDLSELIDNIEQLKRPRHIHGRRGKEVHLIDIHRVSRFFTADKVLLLETSAGEYTVNQRLYQVEKQLPNSFIKISKSEIVNFDFVDHLSFTNKGLVQIFMKNGESTYSSRRYLNVIKERFNL